MLQFLKNNIFTVIGALLGLAGGYLYWYYVGCVSGTCPMQSSPWKMTPYGGLMGGLIGNLLQDFLRNIKAKTGK